MASLLLCLFDGPRSEGVHTVAQLAGAAIEGGHTANVFLGGDGTFHMDALAPLRDRGARVVSCSADAAIRGWDRPGTPGRGSYVDLGTMAAEADAMVSIGCVASLDGRVVVRDGPAVERGWIALRVATALTFTGRPVRAMLDGPGAGWAVQALDVRAWTGSDPLRDLDGLVDDAGGVVLIGEPALASHAIRRDAIRRTVQVVDDGWRGMAPHPHPASVLHVVTGAITDALVAHALTSDARARVPVRALGLHDAVYETAVLARSLDGNAPADIRLCADDCRRRGIEPPREADEYPAIVDAILAAAATFVW